MNTNTQCELCKEVIDQDAEKLRQGKDKDIIPEHIKICAKCGESVLQSLKDNVDPDKEEVEKM